MRDIPEAAVRPAERLRMVTMLAQMSRKIGLTNADVEAIDRTRHSGPAEPVRL